MFCLLLCLFLLSSWIVGTSETFYFDRNIKGDVIGIYNASGTQIAKYSYDSWGKVLSVTGNTTLGNANPFRYRGYYYDTETGFYYLGSRYYDPVVGRWMVTDPLQEKYASVSPYCYVISNPIKFIDPTGLEINMTEICLADEKLKLSTTQSVIKDLISQTGLQLSLDKYNT